MPCKRQLCKRNIDFKTTDLTLRANEKLMAAKSFQNAIELCVDLWVDLGKCFPTVQIKVCALLKVCNWLARHVWNSQMSMKFKEAAEVGLRPAWRLFSGTRRAYRGKSFTYTVQTGFLKLLQF